MKILHYGLTNHLGGIETYLKKITLEMHSSEKMDFSFVIIGNNIPCFYEEFKELGCEFYFITPRKKNYLKNYLELKKIFKYGNFDICHFHLNSLSYLLPVKISKKFCSKVIIHSRNSNVKLGLVSRLLHSINYFAIPRKTTLLAVSDLAGKWMFGNKKFITINNGIDIQKYKFSSISREKIRLNLKIQNDVVITNVGAFRYQKNHEFILKIFKNLTEINSCYKLILVGDGALFENIKNKSKELNIDKNIIFLGNEKNVAEILSASDAFLFPSIFEGFPNALLEAHVSNLPSFYSDSITTDIDYSKLGTRISLTKSSIDWARIIDTTLNLKHKRDSFTNLDELRRFSVSNEIKILKDVYEGKLK